MLTSTIPLTLTARLGGGELDPTAGLVYVGDGRWYDAALGLPLQPDPFGGAPEAPASLNRYASANVDLAAGQSSQALTTDAGRWRMAASPVWASAVSNSISAALTERLLGPAAQRLVERSSWYWLSIEVQAASRRGIRAPLQRLLREGATSSALARRLERGTLSRWSGLVRVGDDYAEWISRLGRRGVGVEARNVAQSVWGFGPKYLTVGDVLPGFGADLFVGGLWQLGSDVLFHPELLNDPGLLARRTAAGAFSNATTGLMGAGIAGGAAFVLGVFGITVSAPVIVVGGLIATVAIEVLPPGKQIENWWFETFNARAPWE